jgi:GntR family transcriptional regulator
MMATDLHKPLYSQIQEYLAEMITSGEIPPDTRLPSERELSRQLDISRMTVRRAITELVNEGLLHRKHGAGTFVARRKVSYDARDLISYAHAMHAHGLKVSTQLLEFSQVPASRRLAKRLHVSIGDELYLVARLRLANRQPIILERSFFPCDRCPSLEEYDLEKTLVYDLLTGRYGVRVRRVAQTIEAIEAADTTAKQLRVEEGDPLLMVTRILYRVDDGEPVMFSQDFLRSDSVRIHSDLTYDGEEIFPMTGPPEQVAGMGRQGGDATR